MPIFKKNLSVLAQVLTDDQFPDVLKGVDDNLSNIHREISDIYSKHTVGGAIETDEKNKLFKNFLGNEKALDAILNEIWGIIVASGFKPNLQGDKFEDFSKEIKIATIQKNNKSYSKNFT